MAAALDCQKNDYQDCGGEEVKQAALDMSKQDLEDYASTSTEDLPEKVAEQHDELEGVLDFDLDPYADDDELAGYYDEFPELRNSDQADDLPDDLENEFLAMLDAEEEEAEEEEEAVAEVSAMATGGCAGASAAKEDDDSEIEDAFGDDESPLLSMEEEERHPFDNLATQTQQKFSVNEARTNRNRLLAEQVMKAWFKK